MIRLQILSGPQAGAQVSVAAGRWLLGSGDHCDLVILDPGVRDEQMSLLVNAQGVSTRTILPGPGSNAEHKQTPEAEVHWRAGEILRLANTSLIWQPEDFDETAGIDLFRRASAAAGLQSFHRRGSFVQWALGSFAALFAVGILLIQASRANADAQMPSRSSDGSEKTSQLQLITARLKAGDFPEVTVEQHDAGVPIVVGWVRDRAELRRLLQNLKGLEVHTSIVEAEEQSRFAQEYLLTRQQSASIRYSGNGVFLIEASGSDESGFLQRVQGLRSAAPLVRRFELDYRVQAPPIAAPQSVSISPPPPPRQLISGIDGISLIGRQRFLTSRNHYVFEGGVLPDGSMVEVIEAGQITLTSHLRTNKENLHGISHEPRN